MIKNETVLNELVKSKYGHFAILKMIKYLILLFINIDSVRNYAKIIYLMS